MSKKWLYAPSSTRGSHGCTAWAEIEVVGRAFDGLEVKIIRAYWCPTCGALEDVEEGDIIVIFPSEIELYEDHPEYEGFIQE